MSWSKKSAFSLITVIALFSLLYLIGYASSNENQIIKFIFTGGPGSGKTTTLLFLEANYDEVFVPESAADTQLILRAQGNQEPWTDPKLNEKILNLQKKRLARITQGNKGRILLDRSPVDILAYEDNPSQPLLDTLESIKNDPSYAKIVFVTQQIGHVDKNLYRYEDLSHAQILEQKQIDNYKKYGFEIVYIPFDTLENRAKQIEAIIESYMITHSR